MTEARVDPALSNRGSVSSAGGILAGSQSLALILINPIIGRVVDHAGSYDAVSIVLGLLVLPTSVIWLAWPTRRSSQVG